VCPDPNYKVEFCSLGERVEVPVPRDERNALVDTALGDQGVPETTKHDRAAVHPDHCSLPERQSNYLCRPRSPVGLQLRQRAREANLASEFPQASISPGRGNQL